MKQIMYITLTALMLVVFAACGSNQETKHEEKQAAYEPRPQEKIDELTETAAQAISKERILEGTKYLSSDELEGRGTGTEGERKAAEWIADQFKQAGLKPLGSGDYFQKVELIGFKKNEETDSITFENEGKVIAAEEPTDISFFSSSQKEKISIEKAPLVFVGYGVEAPEFDWDDYKGFDCSGKILIFLNDDPQLDDPSLFSGETRTYYGRYTYKYEQAMKKGAAGAFVIHTTESAGYGWEVINAVGRRESFALKLPGAGYQLDVLGWLQQDLAGQLAATTGKSLEDWFEMGKSRDFKPVELPVSLSCEMDVELRETASQNVVAVWEGIDPELKDEMVIFSAHYDHLGKLPDEEGKDTIYNGAWDNALGTSCIVEIARAFASSDFRPRRSIAFLACAAEEKGILGSQWFVAKPPVPLKSFIANINIDMPQIFGMTSDVQAVGMDSSTLGDALVQVAAGFSGEGYDKVEVTPDPNPGAGIFYRSDQVHFAKAGIPALFLLPGSQYLGEPTADLHGYEGSHYHQVNDEINESWTLDGCVRDMKIAVKLAAQVAMAQDMPRWHAGNEFEGEWKALHGQ